MKEYNKFIGIPFIWDGRDESGLDCYGLVMEILKGQGHIVPDNNGTKGGKAVLDAFMAHLPLWKEREVSPGCVLLFRIVGGFHCGIYEGNDRFIHTWEPSGGVVRERLKLWQYKLVGAFEYVG